MSVSQLGYLGIGVKDVAVWKDFATTVLGLEALEDPRIEDTLYLRMDELHHRFLVHSDPSDDVLYVGWQAAGPNEFEAIKANFLADGLEFAEATQSELDVRKVQEMIHFTVGGLRNEIFYGPRVLFEKPFASPARVSGFRTGNLGMGHVVLGVDEPSELRRIFIDLCGFRVSDTAPGIGGMFLHCNPREHTAALMPFRRPRNEFERRAGFGFRRLSHVMIEVNSVDDLGFAFDRVKAASVPLRTTLGKHTNDHMISFYMWSPSGFAVEYGWNGRLIDEITWQVNSYDATSMWGHERFPLPDKFLEEPHYQLEPERP